MSKLLCIAGPTATGKTSLAVKLAGLFPTATLISVDSRQCYRGMDIVCGKDHPPGIMLWGIDLVEPDQPCSVSVWYDAVTPALQLNGLAIAVGGTGLYFRALTGGIETLHIPPDPALRQELSHLPVSKLQSRLFSLDPTKYNSLNPSDLANPRRLLRAIEIANTFPPSHPNLDLCDSLVIGLKYYDYSNNSSIVRERVIKRIKQGAVEETQRLLQKYSPTLPSMSALGYKHIINYLKHELTMEELIESWTRDELAYSKRQLTWLRKVQGIKWFDAGSTATPTQVAQLVTSWYTGG